jgi:hypothetical protein
MPPKKVDWAAEAAATASLVTSGVLGQPGRATAAGGGDEDPLAAIRALRRRLRRFWNCHGDAFSAWYSALPAEEKVGAAACYRSNRPAPQQLQVGGWAGGCRPPRPTHGLPSSSPPQALFLRAGAPFLPARRGDATVTVEGKRQDVRGGAMLVPELNAADLCAGDGAVGGLLHLFEQVGAIFSFSGQLVMGYRAALGRCRCPGGGRAAACTANRSMPAAAAGSGQLEAVKQRRRVVQPPATHLPNRCPLVVDVAACRTGTGGRRR